MTTEIKFFLMSKSTASYIVYETVHQGANQDTETCGEGELVVFSSFSPLSAS